MLKRKIVLAFVFAFSMSMFGCIKCEECIATDDEGKEVWRSEACGKKKVRDQGRESCEAMAETNGGTCNCVIQKKD